MPGPSRVWMGMKEASRVRAGVVAMARESFSTRARESAVLRNFWISSPLEAPAENLAKKEVPSALKQYQPDRLRALLLSNTRSTYFH